MNFNKQISLIIKSGNENAINLINSGKNPVKIW